ncbi:hypothetical protein ACFLYJ_00025 [Candidatus Cloacimonadota bacterium]
MRNLVIISIMLLLAISLSAQVIDSAFTPSLLMPSFINQNHMTMNHSISFTGGMSSNNQSFYQSVYTNHISYQFHPKLSLNVDLNFVNYGTATYQSGIEFEGNNDNNSKVLPNFQLNWKPSESTNITIEFKQYHNPMSYNRWWN